MGEHSGVARTFSKEYFEGLFHEPDPWRFTTSPYEQARYADLLASLPEPLMGKRVLEIACAEGAFTELLAAENAASILGIDISETALRRAEERCDRFSAVRFSRHDIRDGLHIEPCDVVFCAEVLTYMAPEELGRVCEDIVNCAVVNGYLLMTHHMPSMRPITAEIVRHAFDATGRLEQLCFHRRELYDHAYELIVYRRV